VKTFEQWLMENSTSTADVAIFSRPIGTGGEDELDRKKTKVNVSGYRDSYVKPPQFVMMKKK
jgi:hypothetical protein